MLVLSRHLDERIRIGPDIIVTVVLIAGDKVRLGIEAPDDVEIHREEIYDQVMRDRAAGVAPVVKPRCPGCGRIVMRCSCRKFGSPAERDAARGRLDYGPAAEGPGGQSKGG